MKFQFHILYSPPLTSYSSMPAEKITFANSRYSCSFSWTMLQIQNRISRITEVSILHNKIENNITRDIFELYITDSVAIFRAPNVQAIYILSTNILSFTSFQFPRYAVPFCRNFESSPLDSLFKAIKCVDHLS